MKRSLRNKIGRELNAPLGERHVDLDRYLADFAAGGRAASRARIVQSGRATRRIERPHSKGQALLLIALMMTVLILFVGLGVDVGNMMGKRAKLQSAVDSSALSAAQLLTDGVISTTIQSKAYQILEANGVPTNTLSTKLVEVNQGLYQVRVRAVQRVDTFFMRIIPMWHTVEVSADATADLNSFAEINIKPFGQPGVMNELMLQTWGPWSWRRGGDVYSPHYMGGSPYVANDEHINQPYGYLFRIDVPSSFTDNELVVQIFDPDTYNNPSHMATPTTMPTQRPFPTPPYANTPTPHAYDPIFFWCPTPDTTGDDCTANQYRSVDPSLKLNGFTRGDWNSDWTSGRAAVWRVDEYRRPYNVTSGDLAPPSDNAYDASWPTTTNFRLWHFDPRITSAFGVPQVMSDQPGGAAIVSTYTVKLDVNTDLAWYEPWAPILLTDPSCFGKYGATNDCFERESNGSFYFYLYVMTTDGSSENDYDIRVGPKDTNYAQGYNCRTLTGWASSHSICYTNEQYYRQSRTGSWSTPNDWTDGGAKIFAKRALPINLATGAAFPMLYTQVSQKAAGQTLAVKHFDQDCANCSSPASSYQMQVCVNVGTTTPCSTGNCEPCSNLLNTNCFEDIASGNDAYRGPNDGWWCPACPQPEKIDIPTEGTAKFNLFFGPNTECETSWMRLERNLSYSNDTTVWEMPYKRPRLIK